MTAPEATIVICLVTITLSRYVQSGTSSVPPVGVPLISDWRLVVQDGVGTGVGVGARVGVTVGDGVATTVGTGVGSGEGVGVGAAVGVGSVTVGAGVGHFQTGRHLASRGLALSTGLEMARATSGAKISAARTLRRWRTLTS
jgi:hypothetical protein